MSHLLCALLATARSSLKSQRELALDRAFWVALSRLWTGWQRALIVVKPEAVINWHRRDFRLYWTWKSRNRPGRPRIDAEIQSWS
jgi:hypothetical protein